ncbi:MAG TPA: hypothetical protein PLI51_01400 [bacterium]|nr:hypothetical protein [bacterium]HPQ65369.1 hypothetical protein [bacterium]
MRTGTAETGERQAMKTTAGIGGMAAAFFFFIHSSHGAALPSSPPKWSTVSAPFSYVQTGPAALKEWTFRKPGAAAMRLRLERIDFQYDPAAEAQRSRLEILNGEGATVAVIDENRSTPFFTPAVDGDSLTLRYRTGINGGTGAWPEENADEFRVAGYSFLPSPGAGIFSPDKAVYRTVDLPPDRDLEIAEFKDYRFPLNLRRTEYVRVPEGEISVDILSDGTFLGSASPRFDPPGGLIFTVDLDLEALLEAGVEELPGLEIRENRFLPRENLLGVRTYRLEGSSSWHDIWFSDRRDQAEEGVEYRFSQARESIAFFTIDRPGMAYIKVSWNAAPEEVPRDLDIALYGTGKFPLDASERHGDQGVFPGTFAETIDRWLEPGSYRLRIRGERGLEGALSLRIFGGYEEQQQPSARPGPDYAPPWMAWYRFNPRIFDGAALDRGDREAVTLEVKIEGEPEAVLFNVRDYELFDNGEAPDLSAGDGIYTGLLPDGLDAVRASITGDGKVAEVGTLLVCHPGEDGYSTDTRYHLRAAVLTDEIPEIHIWRAAADFQFSEHLVNFTVDGDFFNAWDTWRGIIERLYRYLPDDYDQLAVFSLRYFPPGEDLLNSAAAVHQDFSNPAQGIGAGNITRGDPPAERLQGGNYFRPGLFFDGASTGYLHEFGHQYVNWLSLPLLYDPGFHWPPRCDLSGGIMRPNPSGIGKFVPVSPGLYRYVPRPPTREYTDLTLYLMGFLAPEEVEEHYVMREGYETVNEGDTYYYRGEADSFTVWDIIDEVGPRLPAFPDAPGTIRVATAVLSGYPLSREEMRYYDYFAARASARDELPNVLDEEARGPLKPFYVQTRGRGILETRIFLDAPPFPLISRETNRPPAFAPSSLTVGVLAGVRHSLIIHADDPDFDELTYEIVSAPVGGELDPATGRFTWTPPVLRPESTAGGVYYARFLARDPWDARAYLQVRFEVRSAKASPPLKEPPPELIPSKIPKPDPEPPDPRAGAYGEIPDKERIPPKF